MTADPKDYNVRKRTADADPVTEEDFNNQVRSNGQDWYVETQDSQRAADDHLCTPDANAGSNFACSKIKCVVRRNAVTDDPDDYSFNFVAANGGSVTDKTV